MTPGRSGRGRKDAKDGSVNQTGLKPDPNMARVFPTTNLQAEKRDIRYVVPSCSEESLLAPISSLAITDDDSPSSYSGLQPLNDDEKAVMESIEKKMLADLTDSLKVPHWCRRQPEAIQQQSNEDAEALTLDSPMEWEWEPHAIASVPAEAIAGPSSFPTSAQSLQMTTKDKSAFYRTVCDQMNDQEAAIVMQFFEQNKSDIPPALAELHACYNAFKERFNTSSESPEMTTEEKAAFYKTVYDQMNDQEATAVMQFFEQNKSDISPALAELHACYNAFKERFNASSESPEMTLDKTAFYKAVCHQMNDQEAAVVMQFFQQNKSTIVPEFTELQMCYDALKERFNMSSE